MPRVFVPNGIYQRESGSGTGAYKGGNKNLYRRRKSQPYWPGLSNEPDEFDFDDGPTEETSQTDGENCAPSKARPFPITPRQLALEKDAVTRKQADPASVVAMSKGDKDEYRRNVGVNLEDKNAGGVEYPCVTPAEANNTARDAASPLQNKLTDSVGFQSPNKTPGQADTTILALREQFEREIQSLKAHHQLQMTKMEEDHKATVSILQQQNSEKDATIQEFKDQNKNSSEEAVNHRVQQATKILQDQLMQTRNIVLSTKKELKRKDHVHSQCLHETERCHFQEMAALQKRMDSIANECSRKTSKLRQSAESARQWKQKALELEAGTKQLQSELNRTIDNHHKYALECADMKRQLQILKELQKEKSEKIVEPQIKEPQITESVEISHRKQVSTRLQTSLASPRGGDPKTLKTYSPKSLVLKRVHKVRSSSRTAKSSRKRAATVTLEYPTRRSPRHPKVRIPTLQDVIPSYNIFRGVSSVFSKK